MRNIVYLILFLITIPVSIAGTKIIDCNESSCNPDFLPERQVDKLYYTSIDVGQNNPDDIIVKVNENGGPRSLRLSVENNSIVGKNLTVNLTPNNDDNNAGDFLILGDFLNNIEINLNGYSGVDGKNSSKLCYEEYEKEDLGAFGSELKTSFDEARFLEPNLPKEDCVSFDVDNLFDKFQCDDGYTEIEDTNNPSVIVSRIKGKNRCLGLGYINVCLSKTVKVECTYRVKYTFPTQIEGSFDTSDLKKEVRILTLPEQEYNENQNDPAYRKFICNNLSYIDGVQEPFDIIQNGEFYFNIAGWSSNSAVWDDTESIKLLPDLEDFSQIASAQQVISTTPGNDYRVQAVWRKDENNLNVDSGKVSVFSDISKTTALYSENIFENGSIKPVFLTIDSAPYDFGFLKIPLSSESKTFTIKNKDSRDAINCSVVYISGDTSSFSIINQTCGVNNLESGGTCEVTVRAFPQSYGLKESFLKRDCEDDFGNFTSTLNEKISLMAYQDFIQPSIASAPAPETKFIDGFYWRFDTLTFSWQKCQEDYENGKNCFSSTQVESISPDFVSGKWFYGYEPADMVYESGLVVPEIKEPILVKKIDINPSNRFESKSIDFVFRANSQNSVIELKTLIPEHGAIFDKIIVTQLSPTSGPSIKPPSDLKCPSSATEGCVSGSQGHGYYDLASVNANLTSPGIDERYYTVPEESDWRIRYIGLGKSCPEYFSIEKAEHLASNIGYDDNDNLCDDVYIPEDPSSKLIRWEFVNFERKPEFGTELVQCSAGNCLVDFTTEEKEKNLVDFNLGSGTNGTQQGEGVVFIYDFTNLSGTAMNGRGGDIGINNLPLKEEQRSCAKISDANTLGIDSPWASNPKVNFIKYNWKPINIIDEGNFGQTPRNNGKDIKYYKKIDSSVRYLMKNEIF